jgi:hypothetical protein
VWPGAICTPGGRVFGLFAYVRAVVFATFYALWLSCAPGLAVAEPLAPVALCGNPLLSLQLYSNHERAAAGYLQDVLLVLWGLN